MAVATQQRNQQSQRQFSDECYVVKAVGTDKAGKRVTHVEFHDALESTGEKMGAKAAQGYLKFKKGYDNVFVYHAFLMHWDKEAQDYVDSDLRFGVE